MARRAAVPPHRVRVEVSDDRELGNVLEEAVDALVRARVAHHSLVPPARALERQRMLDDVHLLRSLAVAIADEQAEALALVHLDRGDEETPEGVLGDIGDHLAKEPERFEGTSILGGGPHRVNGLENLT